MSTHIFPQIMLWTGMSVVSHKLSQLLVLEVAAFIGKTEVLSWAMSPSLLVAFLKSIILLQANFQTMKSTRNGLVTQSFFLLYRFSFFSLHPLRLESKRKYVFDGIIDDYMNLWCKSNIQGLVLQCYYIFILQMFLLLNKIKHFLFSYHFRWSKFFVINPSFYTNWDYSLWPSYLCEFPFIFHFL